MGYVQEREYRPCLAQIEALPQRKREGLHEQRGASLLCCSWGGCHRTTREFGEVMLNSDSNTLVQGNEPVIQPPNPVISSRPAPSPRRACQAPHSHLNHQSPNGGILILHEKSVNSSSFPPFPHVKGVGVTPPAAISPISHPR